MRLNTWLSLMVLGLALAAAGCKFDPSGVANGDAGGPPDVLPDADEDMDGIPNASDNCVFVANTDQTNSDGDTLGDACDNCDTTDNEDQADRNSDGEGDACDDTDGDTVLDNVDNCWQVANTDQLDGDTDGVGDVCDNCPALSNADQANSDTDSLGDACDLCDNVDDETNGDEDYDDVGDVCDNCPTVSNPGQEAVMDGDPVGDACDPRPTMPGDDIVFFDGFLQDSPDNPPAGWVVSGGPGNATGNWLANGKLRQTDKTNDTDPTILTRNNVGPTMNGVLGNVLVQARVNPGAFAGNESPHVGVVAGYTDVVGLVDNGYHCNLEKQTSAAGGETRLRITEFGLGNTAFDTVNTLTMAGGTGNVYRLDHYQYWDGATNTTTCQAIDTTNGMVYSMTRNFAGPSTGRVGLSTQQVTASFDYIIVYSLGGPLTCTPPARCSWP